MFRTYSRSAIEPSPKVLLSIASKRAPSQPGFTRALTRYRIQVYFTAPCQSRRLFQFTRNIRFQHDCPEPYPTALLSQARITAAAVGSQAQLVSAKSSTQWKCVDVILCSAAQTAGIAKSSRLTSTARAAFTGPFLFSGTRNAQPRRAWRTHRRYDWRGRLVGRS